MMQFIDIMIEKSLINTFEEFSIYEWSDTSDCFLKYQQAFVIQLSQIDLKQLICMIRATLFLALTSILCALSCVQVQPSSLASASDCTISRIDDNTLKWGAVITFLADASHRADNWYNLLADMEHPRLPYFPVGSQCTGQYGQFYSGETATINCIQAFEDLPRDYVNAVYVLEDSVSPFGFSIKLPLGMMEGNLSTK